MTRRSVLAAIAALCLLSAAFGQNVDEAEISSVAGKTVEFISYEGPHSVVETAAAIRGIGTALGRAVAAGARRAGEAGRYSVIHAVDPAVPAGFDADILILGEGSGIDHIRNLRRVIAGYLEGAYAYSAKDADTLAVFITVYNAVYRGDMAYFSSKYKPVVTKELDAATAGLALRWDQWAGRSRIVIPLGKRTGSGVVGSVATGPLTDKPTIQSLGKEEGPATAIAGRQEIVGINERDIEQEKAAIAAEQARIDAEQKAIAEERARVEAQKAAAAQGAAGPAAAGPASAQPGSAQGSAQEAAIAASDKARAEEAALAEREAKLEADKAEVAARAEAVAEKQEAVAADRAAIAEEQKAVIKEEVAAAAQKEASGTTLFQLVDPNLPFARIVLVDLTSGKILRRSEVNTIRAATVTDAGDAWVAVAGQSTALSGAVRLVRIEKSDFAKSKYGADDVFADTMLWKIGASLYAVVKKGDQWAIGRFDPVSLELKATSAPVSKWTFLTETGGKLVAQDPKGGFLVLDPTALTTLSEVAP